MRRNLPLLRPSLLVVALLVSSLPSGAAAQTLAEVTFVAATATQLNPAIRLPTGSMRAIGAGVDALVARLPDAADWTGAEAYAARGLAARLRPAHVQQVTTSFAAAGYFEVARATAPDGAGTRTRIEFEDAGGARMLLVLFDAPDELVWLVAASR